MSETVFHPSEFIQDEMDDRGWSRDALASRMGGDPSLNRLALDMYFDVGPTASGLRMGKDMAAQLGKAFEVSAEFWLALESAWLASAAASPCQDRGAG